MRINQQPIILFFFIILATIPLFLGGQYPLIQGGYTSVILIICGTWLVFHFEQVKSSLVNKAYYPFYVLILFIFFTSISLPLFLLKLLSPLRAEYLVNATSLIQFDNLSTSLSYYAPATRFYCIFLLSLIVFYLFAVNIMRRENDRRVLFWIFTIAGTIEALYGLFQSIFPSMGTLWLPPDSNTEGYARGTILNQNQFAALLNLCWPMTFALGISLYHPIISRYKALRNRKNVSITDRLSLIFQKAALPFWATAVMMLAIIFSGSRTGTCILLLLTALFLRILPFAKRIRAAVIGSFALFFVVFGILKGFQKITDGFIVALELAQDRLNLWRQSFTILKDHLFTGTGAETYTLLSPLYFGETTSPGWLDSIHNEFLELAIGIGIPLATLFILWLLWIVWRTGSKVIKAGRKIDTFTFYPEQLIVGIGSFFALIGFLTHGFFDSVWHLPVNALYAVTIAALLNIALSTGVFISVEK